jgi:hypothetical protein
VRRASRAIFARLTPPTGARRTIAALPATPRAPATSEGSLPPL